MATNVAADRVTLAIEQTRTALQELEAEVSALREQAPELVGLLEASELLQLDRTEFSRRRRMGRIPPPIAELASGPVWLKAQFTWPNTLKEEGA